MTVIDPTTVTLHSACSGGPRTNRVQFGGIGQHKKDSGRLPFLKGKDASEAFIQAVFDALQHVPANLQRPLAAKGIRVLVCKTLPDTPKNRPTNKPGRPEEYTAATYFHPEKALLIPEFVMTSKGPERQTIRSRADKANLQLDILHEVAHAVDYCLGNTPISKNLGALKGKGLLVAIIATGGLILPFIGISRLLGGALGALSVVGLGMQAVKYPLFSANKEFIKALKADLQNSRHYLLDPSSRFLVQFCADPKEAFAHGLATLYVNNVEARAFKQLFPNVLRYIQTEVSPKLERLAKA